MHISITNRKDLPLEYFYLCHINYRPVDGSKLYYTADRKNITAHHEVPGGSLTYHITTGILSPEDSQSMKNEIESL